MFPLDEAFSKTSRPELAFAKAIEQEEEEHGDDGVDQRGDGQMRIEPGLGLRQKNAPGQYD